MPDRLPANLAIKHLGVCDYTEVWKAMRDYTQQRTDESPDQLWLVQHPPVFTQGLAGKPEHLLNPTQIPVVASDRGGQITYHGPGQWVLYVLLDLKRYGLGVRSLVTCLEKTVTTLLAEYNIQSNARCDAPGVYIDGAKIASVGLKIRRSCSYHGLSFNMDMDLSPFQNINPCGYADLRVTQLRDFIEPVNHTLIGEKLIENFLNQLEEKRTQPRTNVA